MAGTERPSPLEVSLPKPAGAGIDQIWLILSIGVKGVQKSFWKELPNVLCAGGTFAGS